MLDKLERKLGKFAIPNLIRWLIGGYIIGYILYYLQQITHVNFIDYMTLEPYYIIHRFQFWRLITWVMIPPSTSIFWALIMMVFYFQLGTILERQWGTFRFNVYIWGGIIFTIIGAFLLYGVYALRCPGLPVTGIGNYFSTSYINMTIFLAFAVMFPEMEVRLYFILPIKMKWMGFFYAVVTLIELIQADWGGRVAIIASLLNFIVYFLATRNYSQIDPREIHRKNAWKRANQRGFRSMNGGRSSYGGQSNGWNETHGGNNWNRQQNRSGYGNGAGNGIVHHRCAVCGRTDVSNPELTFRFCSKCHGNYEYCEDHIFNHKHIV